MDKLEKSRQLLSTAILQNFVGRITGAGLDRIVGSNPENVLLVGKLMSTNDADGQNINSSKTFIESIGVDFYVAEKEMDNAVIKLFPQGDFYYRAVPTIEEQRAAMIREINESRNDNEFKSFEDVEDAYKTNPASFSNYQIRLVPVYKKISLDENTQVSFRLKDIIDESGECGFVDESHRINGELESYLQGVQANIKNDGEAMTQVITEPTRVEHLLSDVSYSSFLENYASKKVQQQNQNWKVYFDIQVKRIGANYLVSCFLVNNSVVLYSGAHRSRKNDKFTVETLFNSGIRVELNNASFCPIELDFFKDDYKYDKTQYALSNNCAVEFIKAENALQTNHLPLYEQYRLITNDNLAVKFLDLVDNPIATLEGIFAKMRKELEDWKQYKEQKIPELTERGKEKLSKEIQGFEDEILNFASGIYVLKNYPIVRKSFVQMNKAFAETSQKY